MFILIIITELFIRLNTYFEPCYDFIVVLEGKL